MGLGRRSGRGGSKANRSLRAAVRDGLDLRALRSGSFRRFLGATGISTAGEWASVACIPVAVHELGGGSVDLAAAFGIYFITVSIVAIQGGALGDRRSRRKLMIGADIFSFAVQGAFALLLLLGHAQIWTLLIAQLLLGVATGLFQPQVNGLIVEYVAEEPRQGANALTGLIESVGTAVGPLLGGVMLWVLGLSWAFAVDAASFLASAALIAKMGAAPYPPDVATRPSGETMRLGLRRFRRGPRGGVAAGWQAFRGRRWVVVIVTVFAVLNAFVFGPFQALGASATDGTLGGGAWVAILASLNLGSVAGGLIVLVWKPLRPMLTGTSLVALWIPPLILLAISAPISAVVATVALAGTSRSVFNTLWSTTVQDQIPEDLLSRISSYDVIGSNALLPFGFAAAAVEIDTVGPHTALLICAGIVLCGTGWAVLEPSIRAIRRTRATRSTPAAPASPAPPSAAGAAGVA